MYKLWFLFYILTYKSLVINKLKFLFYIQFWKNSEFWNFFIYSLCGFVYYLILSSMWTIKRENIAIYVIWKCQKYIFTQSGCFQPQLSSRAVFRHSVLQSFWWSATFYHSKCFVSHVLELCRSAARSSACKYFVHKYFWYMIASHLWNTFMLF